jgi:hypothetical protein
MPVSFAPSQSRSTYFYSMGMIPVVPATGYRLNNCSNTLCYTYNHNYINHAHNARGKIGTTAASFLASRKRI